MSNYSDKTYCKSLTEYVRYRTREVAVGSIPMGGDNPIRVQSMTTTDTMDTLGTVAQSVRIIDAGADYVRITAPSLNEAQNLEAIKMELRSRGYRTPLIADIHFTPRAAELAARLVEKVRINPGNYADRRKFQTIEYSDGDYSAELERIRERFAPLVKICKEYGTAMRIGTNHGSLSDRIMSRFGDTPLGMVESALEFLRICEDLGYHDIVLSMKASNPLVMIQAYRLLVHKMAAEDMAYPLHLGVTEAGEGEDGRIKSALGIGSLLEDGLGDTVRVSLTEEPEAEIPVALSLVRRYARRPGHTPIPPVLDSPIDPFTYTRRNTRAVGRIGGGNVPVVVLGAGNLSGPEDLIALGYRYDAPPDKWHIDDIAPDFIYPGSPDLEFGLPVSLGRIVDADRWLAMDAPADAVPIFDTAQYLKTQRRSDTLNLVLVTRADLTQEVLDAIARDEHAVLVLRTDNRHAMPELRRAFVDLMQRECPVPVVVKREYPDLAEEECLLYAATDLGGLLADGLGDGIWIEAPGIAQQFLLRTAFGILQAARTRICKTEYISCPSCGRTRFDLQKTTAVIRQRTDHLKGVKIGIMGCIVNGPGEMADADYGYVGSGPGKITLYRGRDIVKRNIPTDTAVDELIGLIKEDGRWVERR